MLRSNGKGLRSEDECVKQETNKPDLRKMGETKKKVSRTQVRDDEVAVVPRRIHVWCRGTISAPR